MTAFRDFFKSDVHHAFRPADNPLTAMLGISPATNPPTDDELGYRAQQHDMQCVIVLADRVGDHRLYPLCLGEGLIGTPQYPILGWMAYDTGTDFDAGRWSDEVSAFLSETYPRGFSEEVTEASLLTQLAVTTDVVQRMLLRRFRTLEDLVRPVNITDEFWRNASVDDLLRKSKSLLLNWTWYEKLIDETAEALCDVKSVAEIEDPSIRQLAERLDAKAKAIDAFDDCILELRHEMFD